MPIHVSLDSSALHGFGAAFSRLQSLVSEKIVKVYISEIVQNEISSQLKVEFSEKINNSEVGLRKIIKHQWQQYVGDRTVLDNAYNMIFQAKENLEEITEKGVSEIWQSLQAEILAVQPHHGIFVTRSYFSGTPPFKKIKNREDFPDAFIFESIKDLKTLIADANIHVVVADNTLRNSLSQIGGITVHKDLDEFVHCEDVGNLARQSELEKHWNEIYETVLPKLPTIEDAFKAAIQAITYELTWKELHHPNIPEDNNEAVISILEEPDEIAFMWEDVKNYGSGLITIPFEFETISEIQFKVYRGDAFGLDDEIYVEYKDPEANHYFDASGTVKIEVTGTISVQFENEEVEPEGIINLLKEIQFNEIKSIDIVEAEDGSIFI